jgi:hypothetical protein
VDSIWERESKLKCRLKSELRGPFNQARKEEGKGKRKTEGTGARGEELVDGWIN